MSIEQNLSSIAKSLELIAAVLSAGKQAAPVATPAPVVAAPVVAAPAPVVAPVPAPVVAATTMFAALSQAQGTDTGGITDAAGLLAFVMDAYKSLGPIKGANIQNVLTSIGVKNINEVQPAQYATVVAGVNALRG